MIFHKKNTAYYLSFPMVDSATPESFKSGVSPVDTAYYKDGAGAWTSLAITDTASEIGATGIYEIDLTAAEMNHDLIVIKFSVSGAADTAFLFNMINNDYVADAVLDDNLSSHNNNGSLGKAIRQIVEGVVSAESSVNDASATTTSFITNLTETDDGFYNDKVLVFIDGNLSGESKPIKSYNGTTKAVSFDAIDAYTQPPADGDGFIILSSHVHPITQIANSVTTDIDANSTKLASIETDTQDLQTQIGAAGAGLTDLGGMSTEMKAEVNAEADTAIADAGLATANALAIVDGLIDAIKAVTDLLPNSGALTDLASAADLATVDSKVDSILTDTGTSIPALIAALNDVSVTDILTTQMTESYAAPTAAPTLAQALYMIQQFLTEFTITNTTYTVKKLDGSTVAATYELDDLSPTGNTRDT
jgi:hypothetical protein